MSAPPCLLYKTQQIKQAEANSHLSAPIVGVITCYSFYLLMVRLEEIDANGITLYSPLLNQHDLLWLFPGP